MRNSPPRRISMRANCCQPDRQGDILRRSVKIARVARPGKRAIQPQAAPATELEVVAAR